MPVPQDCEGAHERLSGRIPYPEPPDDHIDVTELRVHGVGGATPALLLDDLAPTQVAGDRIAGFYRTSDLAAKRDGGRDGRREGRRARHMIAGFHWAADLAAHRDGGGHANREGRRTRHVEVYSWGGLTSRSNSRVLWLFLLPFLLGNLAGWMFHPSRRGVPVQQQGTGARFVVHRMFTALACLALTINATLLSVMITVDLLGYQAVRSGLTNQWWLWPLRWNWVRGDNERPMVIGSVVVLLVVLSVAGLTWLSRQRYERIHPPTTEDGIPLRDEKASAADLALSSPGFWDGAAAVARLTFAHLAAAIGFLAVVLAITAKAAAASPVRDTVWYWAALVIGGFALLVGTLVVATDHWIAPPLLAPERVERRATLGSWSAKIASVFALAALACGALFAWQQPASGGALGTVPGLAPIEFWVYVALGALALVLGLNGAVGAVTAALSERGAARPPTLMGSLVDRAVEALSPTGDAENDRWSPVGPATTLVLAAGLLNTMLLGVLLAAGHSLGLSPNPVSGSVYLSDVVTWIAPVLILALVAAAVPYLLVFLAAVHTGRARFNQDAEEYRQTLASVPEPEREHAWAYSMLKLGNIPAGIKLDDGSKMKKWERMARRRRGYAAATPTIGLLLWLIATLQLAGTIAVLAVRPRATGEIFSPNRAAGTVAAWVATLVPFALMFLLRWAWNDPTRRRKIAIIWDVGTFWPRSYHPFAPPSYAERAVPDLQRRIWHLNDRGSGVLVVAHSQGSVLAAAALLQPEQRAADGEIALATFGSPLPRLYGWAFPLYFGGDVLREILDQPGPRARVLRWHNFSYPTDPLGGRMGWLDGGDNRFIDPPRCWHLYDSPPPEPGGHSGYWTDKRVWDDIDQML